MKKKKKKKKTCARLDALSITLKSKNRTRRNGRSSCNKANAFVPTIIVFLSGIKCLSPQKNLSPYTFHPQNPPPATHVIDSCRIDLKTPIYSLGSWENEQRWLEQRRQPLGLGLGSGSWIRDGWRRDPVRSPPPASSSPPPSPPAVPPPLGWRPTSPARKHSPQLWFLDWCSACISVCWVYSIWNLDCWFSVLGTLVKSKAVPDPFYGLNNESILDIGESGRDYYTFWFLTTFDCKLVSV